MPTTNILAEIAARKNAAFMSAERARAARIRRGVFALIGIKEG